MKCSLVMSTYNGMKYIEAQLESIKNQTRAPDEVLIVDDCSQDGTFQFLLAYIKRENLNWKVEQNPKNLGWQASFMNAIDKAEGEIIFLSDQDDVCSLVKMEKMLSLLEQHSNANIVMCECKKFYTDTPDIDDPKTISNQWHWLKPSKNNACITYPGCSYCFRKSFFEKIKRSWFEKVPHDQLLYMAGWMSESIIVCDEVLHYFRRHEGCASEVKTIYDRNQRLEMIKRELKILDNLSTDVSLIVNPFVSEYRKWIQLRIKLVQNREISSGIKLVSYFPFYPNSYKSWGVDMLSLIK